MRDARSTARSPCVSIWIQTGTGSLRPLAVPDPCTPVVVAVGLGDLAECAPVYSGLFGWRFVPFANCLKILFTAIGIPVGFILMGIAEGSMVAMSDPSCCGVIACGFCRTGQSALAQDTKATALLIATLVPGLAAARWR